MLFRSQGTGLGLAVVLGIVKAHNGLMQVESRAGKGSRFDVYFPVTEEENAEPEDPGAVPPKGRGEEILVVDDERFFLEVLKEHLEGLGYRVTADYSSRRALETFDREPNRFGLVIMDQTMPELAGIQLISEIRKSRSDIPVVLCTGYSDTVTEQTIRNDGFTKFLMKPISRHDLAWVAHDALNQRR